MKFKNSKGTVYYGMHFYPGVAEYSESGKDPYRVFINEDTIRKMSPSFAGRPIFVEHVEEVDQSVDELRKDADGWVVESFFNSADGKTWVKFIVVSERAERAIKNGFKLSNAYVPKSFGKGGLWNGVTYAKEVTEGEYEHLAIVRNPRYEESQILNPEQFKAYNEGRELELKRLANSKTEGENEMKLNFFKKQKVENALDFEGVSVTLPKSGKEKTIIQLVNEADDMMEKDGKPKMANADDEILVGDTKMKVSELLAKLEACQQELAVMKESQSLENEDDGEEAEESESMDNEDDEKDREAAIEAEKKKKNDDKEKPVDEKKKNTADKDQGKNFKALKNAHQNANDEVVNLELMEDQVARGKTRYGS